MDAQDRRKRMRETFDAVSPGYDNPALRFFSETARCLAGYLDVTDGSCVLDAATGTGNVALEVARRLPGVKVTGIDFSAGMLRQAKTKASAAGLGNAEFLEMDMQEIAFADDYFDAAVCSFGVFFADDMMHQLRLMAAKVRPGGRVIVTGFHEDAFRPLMDIFGDHLERYGIERPSLKWKLISTPSRCEALFREAGLSDIRVDRRDHGYFLRDAGEWWDVIWNAGLRSRVSQLSPENLRRFREEHLHAVERTRTEDGIRLNIEVLYTSGVKAAQE